MVDKSKDSPSITSESSESKSVFSGWLDYIWENTSNVSNLIQFGEKEENYSLSNDYECSKRLYESTTDRIKARLSTNGYSDDTENSGLSSQNRIKRKLRGRSVVDKTLYDRLEVKSSATKAEIKASYRKLALKYHPDKNDSKEAKKKFQEIGEAYSILSDDASRDNYDISGLKNGKCVLDLDVDPLELFVMFLGCDLMEEYIGTVKLEAALRYTLNYSDRSFNENFNNFALGSFSKSSNGPAVSVHKDDVCSYVNTVETFRIAKLAVLLRDRINSFAELNKIPDDFVEFMEKACEESYVDLLVSSVGWIYENAADTYISETTSFLGLGATLSNLQSVGRNLNNGINIVKSSISALSVCSQYNSIKNELETDKTVNKKESSEEIINKKTMETFEAFLECSMDFVIYDVESAVRQACVKVCKDEDVDEKTRLRRAQIMRKIGIKMQSIAEKVRNKQGQAKVDVYKTVQKTYIRAKKMSER